MSPTSIHEDAGSIPLALLGGLKSLCCCSSVAPVRPRTWELPYAMSAALKSKKLKINTPLGSITGDQATSIIVVLCVKCFCGSAELCEPLNKNVSFS